MAMTVTMRNAGVCCEHCYVEAGKASGTKAIGRAKDKTRRTLKRRERQNFKREARQYC